MSLPVGTVASTSSRAVSPRSSTSDFPRASASSRVAQRLDLALVQVCEPGRLARGAAHAQSQLRDAEQRASPGRTRSIACTWEREAERLAADEARLDAQVVAIDPPTGDEPRDDAKPDDRRTGAIGAQWARGSAGAEQGRQQDDQAADDRPAPHKRRQRVKPVPAVGLRGHIPAARDSPSSPAGRAGARPRRGRDPGMRASLAAAAVCMRTVASPKDRSTGPAVTSMNCMRPYGTTERRDERRRGARAGPPLARHSPKR